MAGSPASGRSSDQRLYLESECPCSWTLLRASVNYEAWASKRVLVVLGFRVWVLWGLRL